ncbi:MAG TPA: cytochrome c oxidase subunit 3 family protein [Ectothiorhodospiraceae bacterium]|nr:cytochrome c oxidase subunit 3 family protein [Ectothiorhodospiraceae bacterium]
MSEQTLSQKQEYPPGDLVIWIFIYAELLVFGVLFIAYAFSRSNNLELFNESQRLVNQEAGALNTLILITSSYFVVRAVAAIREGRVKRCGHWLLATMVMGGGFIVVKLFEFSEKFSAGINLSTNTFFTYYLSMTVFHFMHVGVGIIILGFVWWKNHKGGYSQEDHMGVETGASYWHMVDLVWIILFPLVYVIR